MYLVLISCFSFFGFSLWCGESKSKAKKCPLSAELCGGRVGKKESFFWEKDIAKLSVPSYKLKSRLNI